MLNFSGLIYFHFSSFHSELLLFCITPTIHSGYISTQSSIRFKVGIIFFSLSFFSRVVSSRFCNGLMSLTKRQFTTNNGLVKKEKKNIEYETCDVWEDGEMEKQESSFSPEVYCKPSLELEHFNFREMSYQFCIFRFYFIFVMKSKVLMKNR